MKTKRSRTTRQPRKRWGGTSTRVAIAAILAGVCSIAYAQVSSANEAMLPLNITARAKSMEQVTINTPTGTRSASTGLFHVGQKPGEGVTGYCVEPERSGFTFMTYKALEPSSYLPAGASAAAWEKNQARLAWVLEHSFPQADPGAMLRAAGANLYNPERVAVGATQMAIWSLIGAGITPGQGNYGSTGTVMDIFKFQSAGARNEGTAVNQVYKYLMDGASKIGDSAFSNTTKATSSSAVFNSTHITQVAGNIAGSANFTYVGPIVVSSSTGGNNVSVQYPSLPANFGFVSVSTNGTVTDLTTLPANEPFFLKVPKGSAPGQIQITASASASASAGGDSYRRILVWKPNNGSTGQSFIALDQNGGSVTAKATASASSSAMISWGNTPNTPKNDDTPGKVEDKPKPNTPSDQPAITTVAQGQIISGQGGTVSDTVNYVGLTPNAWYVLKGRLMDKCSEDPVTKMVTSRPFQAAAGGKGAAILSFDVTPSMMKSVTSRAGCKASLVAFEYLYQALDQTGASSAVGKEFVAKHADINAASQTVTVSPAATPIRPGNTTPGGTTLPHTGANDTTMSFLVIGLALVAFGAVTALMGRRRRDEFGFDF